jgi:LssY C-terminus
MMLGLSGRMARFMRTIRFLSATLAIVLVGLLALHGPASVRAQIGSDTPAPQPSTNPPTDATFQTSSVVPAPSAKKRLSKNFTLKGDTAWLDTGVDLQPGERLVVAAQGKLRYADAKNDNGPEGLSRGFKDLLRILPFNGAGRGAVIALIGDADTSQPFLVGASTDVVSPITGRVRLGINQMKSDTGDGSYTVCLDVYAADSSSRLTPIVSKSVTSIPGIDNALFAKIPRRIADKAGNPGDMVNFLILGSEDAMQRVFTTAGWVKVDSDVQNTLIHGLIDSLSKESYLTMPMSQLYLFGRSQDYGWAHAEPISVVRTRNHLRIWKASFTLDGETLWVGAATHDIGFERDQRNNGVTHKIDPDIDLERDYVEKTLSNTGLVAEISHFLPENPMREAKTATGGTFHSNGQVLILKLGDTGAAGSTTAAAGSQLKQ